MSIVFEVIGSVLLESEGRSDIVLTQRGRALEIGATTSAGRSLLALGHTGIADVFDSGDLEPPLPALGASSFTLSGGGQGWSREFAAGMSTMAYSHRGAFIPPNRSVGRSAIAFEQTGDYFGPLTSYAYLSAGPSVVTAYSDFEFLNLQETIALGGRTNLLPTAVMRELVAMQAQRRATYEGTVRAADSAVFTARLAWVVRLLLQEGVSLSGTGTADFTQLVRVVSRLLASGTATHLLDAMAQLVDGIVLLAAQEALPLVDATDTVRIGEVLDSLYTAVASAVARVLLQSTATGTQQMVVVVRDGVALNADLSNQVDLVMLMRESVGFAATLSIDNGEYIAWVLNTESKGLSRYTNYPFNSMTKIGRRYYGAASDGIHRLEGADDNGADINAFIRAGLSDYGTRLRKRIPEAFIGYSSDGTLVLRVIIVDEEGNKAAAHYTLPVRGAANKQANRFKLGRGLESVDWAFEVHNVDGSAFDISSIEFRPAILSRRTRG